MVAQALALEASFSFKVGAVLRSADSLKDHPLAAHKCGLSSSSSVTKKLLSGTRREALQRNQSLLKKGVMASVVTADRPESSSERVEKKPERAAAVSDKGYGGLPLLTSENADLLKVSEDYAFAVLGDLHLEPSQMKLCNASRDLILKQLSTASGELAPGAQVFQLGDLGGYSHKPGSNNCFEVAKEFLSSFGVPVNLVLGNHDLEGFDDFRTDAENLEGWRQRFGEHYWVREVGNGSAIAIGMSTVRFRDAEHSSHEVFIDEEQITWFRDTLEKHKDKPVFVFTHAPPMGSNLTSLQEVHVRNRCAWLNHSHRPEVFIEIVRENPQIKLWFSGHYHLSHDYERSMNLVNNCMFVQTGVMAKCDRDGRRQSRLVRGGADGFKIYTVDHVTGRLRLDLVHAFNAQTQDLPETVRKQLPSDRLESPTAPVWLASSPGLPGVMSCMKGGAFSPEKEDEVAGTSGQEKVTWITQGSTLLAINSNQIVQYDPVAVAPLGVVCDRIDGRKIRLLTSDGREPSTSAEEIAAIELEGPGRVGSALVNAINGKGTFRGHVERIERNEEGGFWYVYQYNKYKLLKQKLAAATAKVVSTLPYSWQH